LIFNTKNLIQKILITSWKIYFFRFIQTCSAERKKLDGRKKQHRIGMSIRSWIKKKKSFISHFKRKWYKKFL